MIKIEPERITKFDRTPTELELFLIFCVLVANKPSDTTAQKVNGMFIPRTDNAFNLKVFSEALVRDEGIHSPFAFIYSLIKHNILIDWLKYWRTGQYSRISKCLVAINKLFNEEHIRLDRVSIEQLESIHGIGPKTARFFVLHSRLDQKCAVLDTHVLKWLKEVYGTNARTTPTSPRDYKLLEGLLLGECLKWNKTPVEMDSLIWNYYYDRKKFKPRINLKQNALDVNYWSIFSKA